MTSAANGRVKALLGHCVFVRVDTDKHPDIAKQAGVEGLPDIRFVLPDGTVIQQLRDFQDTDSFISELERLLQQTEKLSR